MSNNYLSYYGPYLIHVFFEIKKNHKLKHFLNYSIQISPLMKINFEFHEFYLFFPKSGYSNELIINCYDEPQQPC